MTAVAAPPRAHFGGVARVSAGRLFRLELRRNAMMWAVPLMIALFWFDTYRSSMITAPLWGSRTMLLRGGAAMMDFAPLVAGAAAWTGSRDGRRGTVEQVAMTALPRWAAWLSGWAATACWAVAAYLGCVGALYGMTARQGATGDPLWWPVLVSGVGVVAFSAAGSAAGVWFPSRFTAPLVAIVALVALTVTRKAGGDHMLVSPMKSPAYSVGAANPQDGVFYRFLPDVSLIQIMFLGGLAVAALGSMGLRATSGARWLRSTALVAIATGLAAAGTGFGLAGTARAQVNGIAIPALHNAADDRPLSSTPVCSGSPVPVCLNPAYRMYLKITTSVLEPVLSDLAGLPGAPQRVTQALFTSQDPGVSTATISGEPPVLHVALAFGFKGNWSVSFGTPNAAGPPPNAPKPSSSARLWLNVSDVTAEALPPIAVTAINNVVGRAGPAQEAVAGGLLLAAGLPLTDVAAADGGTSRTSPPAPGTPVSTAAHRFAALPDAARRGWLAGHLTLLRTGQITLAQLP